MGQLLIHCHSILSCASQNYFDVHLWDCTVLHCTIFVIAERYVLFYLSLWNLLCSFTCFMSIMTLMLDCAASTWLQLALTHDAFMWPLHVPILTLDTLLLKVPEMYKVFVADYRLIGRPFVKLFTVHPMLSDRCLSVCLSVCLWRWCIVAKQLDGSRWNLASR